MNIYQLILPTMIFVTFVVSCLPLFRHFLIICIPFGLSMFAIWKGFYGHYDPIFFIIPGAITFITLLMLIYKAVEGDLL